MMEDPDLCSEEGYSSKCIICCGSLEDNSNDDKPKLRLSSVADSKLLFSQFCERFLSLKRPASWKGLSVCSNCSENVRISLDTRSKMELVEGRVRKLQLGILEELKELKMYVELLAWQLGKIERCVKEADGGGEACLETENVDGRTKRGRPPSRRRGLAQSRSIQDDHLVRKLLSNLLKVTNDLDNFRGGLKEKVSCDTKTIRFTPKSVSSFSCDSISSRTMDDRDHQEDKDGSGSGSEPEMSGGDEYLPSPSSAHEDSTIEDADDDDHGLEMEMSRDLEPIPSKQRRRTLLNIRKIKSEPVSDADEEVDDAVNSETESEFAQAATSSSKQNPRSDQWTTITISEKKLKQDFRKESVRQNKSFTWTGYYCAHGVKRRACPVRIRVKQMSNGVRQIVQNDREHDQHRDGGIRRGLTKRQKLLVEECIKQGVERPSDIFLCFKDKGLKPPPVSKILVFKQERKRTVVKIKEGGGEIQDEWKPSTGDTPETGGNDDNDIEQSEAEADEEDDLVLDETSGELKSKDAPSNCRWKATTISEEKLKQDYRIFSNRQLQSCHQIEYYCAYATKRMGCPVRIKAKQYKNGMRLLFQNNQEHRNHRRGRSLRGLTMEQKRLMEECMKQGVTKPSDIFHYIKHKGLKPPPISKIKNFKQEWKRTVEKIKEEGDGGQNRSESQDEQKPSTGETSETDGIGQESFPTEVKKEAGEGDIDNPTEETDEDEDFVLCEKSGGLKSKTAPNDYQWKATTIPEEELKEDYRILGHRRLQGCHQTEYYCAHGTKRMACPVRIKDKQYKNGMRLLFHNNREHRNHRRGSRGLTEEQKLFVEELIKKEGVDKPTHILCWFREEGLEEPDLGKLKNHLNRLRKKEAAELKKIMDAGQSSI